MDMPVQFPSGLFVDVDVRTPETEYASLAEHRRRVACLIEDFQQAIVLPNGVPGALQVLKEILPCADAYFSLIESMLDKISAAGAAPHREEHRRILVELKESLERHSRPGSRPNPRDLVHVLDSLVMHEAAIRLRELGDRPPGRSRRNQTSRSQFSHTVDAAALTVAVG